MIFISSKSKEIKSVLRLNFLPKNKEEPVGQIYEIRYRNGGFWRITYGGSKV